MLPARVPLDVADQGVLRERSAAKGLGRRIWNRKHWVRSVERKARTEERTHQAAERSVSCIASNILFILKRCFRWIEGQDHQKRVCQLFLIVDLCFEVRGVIWVVIGQYEGNQQNTSCHC